ncbi:MAG: type II secretion system F family protein [Pseudomonadales bacterium]|nr:type II secretion system F family protein [Pseudomonadales bacterium]
MKNLRISGNEKISLIGNMATMLGAGIPMFEAVEALLVDSKGGTKKILEQLQEDLTAGHHIHTNFARFPRVFDKISVNLIKAAEEAGKLEVILLDLRNNLQKEMEFTDRIRSALTYPILVLIVFILVIFTMLIVVIPKISTVFSRLKMDLPLPTKILIFVSNALLTYWPLILTFSIISLVTVYFLYRQKKEVFLSMVFSLPLVSRLMQEIDVTRFTRSMHLLLSSGIPFVYALELAQEVVLKKEVSQIIRSARELAQEGKQFSQALRTKVGVFPSVAVKLIEVGEKTGQLDKSMGDISEQMDYTVSRTLASVTSLLEPLMLVFVGISVGAMMMAIIAPIYGLIGQVGQR